MTAVRTEAQVVDGTIWVRIPANLRINEAHDDYDHACGLIGGAQEVPNPAAPNEILLKLDVLETPTYPGSNHYPVMIWSDERTSTSASFRDLKSRTLAAHGTTSICFEIYQGEGRLRSYMIYNHE